MIGLSDIIFFILGLFFSAAFPTPADLIRTTIKGWLAVARDWFKGLSK